MYTKQDYEYLLEFLQYMQIIVTPNILTEVSNLSRTLNNNTNLEFYRFIQNFIDRLNGNYIQSRTAINTDCFLQFGLTDSTINNLSKKGYLVLTDDFPLFGYLISNNRVAINFNHIRTEYYLE